MNSIQSDLEAIIKELGLVEELKLQKIQKAFTNLFKPPFTAHLYPVKLNKGELLFHVDSNEWLYEIRLHEQKMLEKLRPYGVSSIRFRLGRIKRPTPKKTEKKTKDQKVSRELPEDLEKDIQTHIKDPELQRLIRSAIGASISIKARD